MSDYHLTFLSGILISLLLLKFDDSKMKTENRRKQFPSEMTANSDSVHQTNCYIKAASLTVELLFSAGTHDRYQIVNDGLKIKNVTRDDKGLYTCKIYSPTTGDMNYKTIEFTVHRKYLLTNCPLIFTKCWCRSRSAPLLQDNL